MTYISRCPLLFAEYGVRSPEHSELRWKSLFLPPVSLMFNSAHDFPPRVVPSSPGTHWSAAALGFSSDSHLSSLPPFIFDHLPSPISHLPSHHTIILHLTLITGYSSLDSQSHPACPPLAIFPFNSRHSPSAWFSSPFPAGRICRWRLLGLPPKPTFPTPPYP